MLRIKAKIEDLTYNPTMCKNLNKYSLNEFYSGKSFQDAAFRVQPEENEYAISWWVSPKRTRSYPRARVYDTYNHKNRVTIIPLVKDEGKDGERDYLQWDTLSLMSLLQVNVIIAPYKNAEKNDNYDNKITNQKFDFEYIKEKFEELQNYQSDALHWNLKQASELGEVAELSKKYYYDKISSKTGVKMHSKKHFEKRMDKITEEADRFKKMSRNLAEEAQNREALTLQPKESTRTDKCVITIQNHLGGEYYFTSDEVMRSEDKVFLIEKKHTRDVFPSLADIKNGLVRMMLFKNLSTVKAEGDELEAVPVLGITGDELEGYCSNSENIEDNLGDGISDKKIDDINSLMQEANENDFTVIISQNNDSVEDKLYSNIM